MKTRVKEILLSVFACATLFIGAVACGESETSSNQNTASSLGNVESSQSVSIESSPETSSEESVEESLRFEKISGKNEYKVVDFPHPVGPVSKTMPYE